jgi:hypothetical protein
MFEQSKYSKYYYNIVDNAKSRYDGTAIIAVAKINTVF